MYKKMTTEELREFIESIAILQKKSAEEFREQKKETDEQMKRTDEQMKRTDKKIEKLSEEFRKEQRKTDEQMKRTDKKLASIGIKLGNVTNNNGEIAEEFFYSSFEKNKELGEVKYEYIGRNWTQQIKNIEEEYDIIMTNGKSIAIIEVKTKAHKNDITRLERKIVHFKKLFPIYKDFKVYGGLATLVLTEIVKNELIKKGFFAIKQQGNHISIISPQHFYKVTKKDWPVQKFIPRVF
jgi:Holliday junction resolvase-like predicted endonuclease